MRSSVLPDKEIALWFPVLEGIVEMSEDTRKVGCIALDSESNIRGHGYNVFPDKVIKETNDDMDEESKSAVEARLVHPGKLLWTGHAEENMVARAASGAGSLRGTLVIIMGKFPCHVCARMLITARISSVIATRPVEGKWLESNKIASQMFLEKGIDVRFLDEIEA